MGQLYELSMNYTLKDTARVTTSDISIPKASRITNTFIDLIYTFVPTQIGNLWILVVVVVVVVVGMKYKRTVKSEWR